MRYFSKLAALTTVMALAAGAALGAPALAAHAATPSCASSCIDPYVKQFGWRHGVLDVYKGAQAVGQPVILFAPSNSDQAEDWDYSLEGTVNTFLAAGLVSKAVALQYGANPAYEIQYAPYGAESGLCAGTVGVAVNNAKVTLQPCGVTAATVWIADIADASGSYAPLINGTDLNFSHPYVLAYPGSRNPVDKPRPQLLTHTLQRFAGNGAVYDTQLWSARTGTLP